MTPLSPWKNAQVKELLNDIRSGKMVILVDDEDRENEGDLVIAADKATSESINFMARFGRGLICLALDSQILDRLKIPMMVERSGCRFGTNFTVSIEARTGVTTGISAADRARTIQAAINPEARPDDIVMPGHMFPLRAEDGGVLRRAGQTEGSVDFARLSGLQPAGVICEIMKDNGEMARRPDLEIFADHHGLKIGTIADLIAYRMQTESLVSEEKSESFEEIRSDEIEVRTYLSKLDGARHFAIVKGKITPDEEVLVRVHSECATGDVFHEQQNPAEDQLQLALKIIENEKTGVLVYMRQPPKHLGLVDKIRAFELKESGFNLESPPPRKAMKSDLRDYGIGAQILRDLGVRKMKLITNSPNKIVGLEGFDLEVTERVSLQDSSRLSKTYNSLIRLLNR